MTPCTISTVSCMHTDLACGRHVHVTAYCGSDIAMLIMSATPPCIFQRAITWPTVAHTSSSVSPGISPPLSPLSLRPLLSHLFFPPPPLSLPPTTSHRYPPSRSDDVANACMPSHTMSEDTKSTTHRGRRLLVLANPDPGDSSSSDDDRRRRYHLPQSSHSSLHQPPSSIPPPSPHRAVNKPANPTLTTDLPHHISSSHSNPTLSSPSSQSSNAVESTPPPSTPGQAAPPDIATTLFNDDGSAVNDRSDLPQPSRIQKMADKLWKPRRGSSHRPKESECSLHVRITI